MPSGARAGVAAGSKAPPCRTWWVYLLQCVDGSFYAGATVDLAARFEAHLAGRGAAYTRARPPLWMVAARQCGDRGDALRMEYALKQLERADKLAFFASDEFDPLCYAGAELDADADGPDADPRLTA